MIRSFEPAQASALRDVRSRNPETAGTRRRVLKDSAPPSLLSYLHKSANALTLLAIRHSDDLSFLFILAIEHISRVNGDSVVFSHVAVSTHGLPLSCARTAAGIHDHLSERN
jgi:hypothetical protein